MRLKDVLKSIDVIEYKGNLDNEITNITSDSRGIEKNGLFVAIIDIWHGVCHRFIGGRCHILFSRK